MSGYILIEICNGGVERLFAGTKNQCKDKMKSIFLDEIEGDLNTDKQIYESIKRTIEKHGSIDSNGAVFDGTFAYADLSDSLEWQIVPLSMVELL